MDDKRGLYSEKTNHFEAFFGGGELGEFRSESDILMLANFHFVIQISTKQRIIIDICTDLDNVCVCVLYLCLRWTRGHYVYY